MQVRVNRAYDDSDESLRVLAVLAEYAPSRKVTAAPGDKLAELFVREYGFGVSNLPKSYALLQKAILARNHVSRPEDLLTGPLNFPAIPRRVLMGFNRKNPYNFMADMMFFGASTARPAQGRANRNFASEPLERMQSAADIAYAPPVPIEQVRSTAPYELLRYELPLKIADTLLESTSFTSATFMAASYPMPVRLASEGDCDTEPASRDHATLTQAQRDRIAGILKSDSKRAPVVFILDTGWPSQPAYDESFDVMYEVIDSVWRDRFARPFRKPARQAAIPPAKHQHCRCIERALKELRELDQNLDRAKRIRVVYIPLTREQHASSMLVALLETNDLLQLQVQDNARLTDKVIRDSNARAQKFVNSHFPPEWVGEEVRTDKSILDAILAAGRIYAKVHDTVFFASESWTVNHEGKYQVFYEAPEYGIVTSAAGNDPTSGLQDFAQRSFTTKDTMAILNMTAKGVASDSSLISVTDIDRAMVAGFDGDVTDNIHGTSFAAPRVAWFLAAGEAVRYSPLDVSQWANDLHDRLKAMRDPHATGYLKLLFDPVKYIETETLVNTKLR